MNILIGCTGSVATIVVPDLLEQLKQKYGNKITVQLVVTKNGEYFLQENVSQLSERFKIHRDADEWMWQGKGDPVLHIELRKWAGLFLVCPLDANTLAKLATGVCDNLLTSVARAWDFAKPIVCAPAMNTLMWEHPITAQHLRTLTGWGYGVIDPIAKTLVCGDSGMGALATVPQIIECISQYIKE